MIRVLILCFILTFTANLGFALNKVDSTEKVHSPQKAAIISAIIPGWGQAYNKQYWKIPVIYAGFATLAYFIEFNQKKYSNYKNAYILRTDNDSTTIDNYDCYANSSSSENEACYTEGNLLTLKDYYRRNRDLTFILTATLYFLNIIDASVYGHLFNFDISDDLSLHIRPSVEHVLGTVKPVMSLNFQF